ncbi:hypothetical protein GCM10010245_79650 [Streptomyces spectabilis]|nr:hypothetical protein GCM10010245_79650 [Streptomyces spectabilis]
MHTAPHAGSTCAAWRAQQALITAAAAAAGRQHKAHGLQCCWGTARWEPTAQKEADTGSDMSKPQQGRAVIRRGKGTGRVRAEDPGGRAYARTAQRQGTAQVPCRSAERVRLSA